MEEIIRVIMGEKTNEFLDNLKNKGVRLIENPEEPSLQAAAIATGFVTTPWVNRHKMNTGDIDPNSTPPRS